MHIVFPDCLYIIDNLSSSCCLRKLLLFFKDYTLKQLIK